MSTYWITFRLKDGYDYDERYGELQETIRQLTDRDWWLEPTSFIAFKSTLSTSQIAAKIKAVIDTSTDVVLLTRIGYKDHRLIGSVEDTDVYKLFPDLQ